MLLFFCQEYVFRSDSWEVMSLICKSKSVLGEQSGSETQRIGDGTLSLSFASNFNFSSKDPYFYFYSINLKELKKTCYNSKRSVIH